MGNKKMFKDREQWKKYVPNPVQPPMFREKLTSPETQKLYDEVVVPPIKDAGLVLNEDLSIGCGFGSCCLARPQINRLRAGDYTFFRYRYGEDIEWPKKRLGEIGGRDYFRKYREDCRMDINHPDRRLDFDPANEGSRYGWSPPMYPFKRDWWGDREVAENDFEEEVPYSSLSLKELDYVIETHNAKWGKIKPISRDGLDLDYIFPGQGE